MKFFHLIFLLFIVSIFSKSFGCHETGDSNCTPNKNVYTASSGSNNSHQDVEHHEEIKDDSFNDNPRLEFIIDDFGKEIRGSTLNNIRSYKLKTKGKQMFIIQVENLLNNLKNDEIDHHTFLKKIKSMSKKVLIIINENDILDKNEKLQLLNEVNHLIDLYINISLGENKKYTRINYNNNVNKEMAILEKRMIDLDIVNKTMEIFYSNNLKSIDKNDLNFYKFKINNSKTKYLQNSIKDVNYAKKVLELMKNQ